MNDHQNRNGRAVPAFLTENHRGLESPARQNMHSRCGWTPQASTRRVVSAAQALPKLAAQIGLSASCVDSEVEILPGKPTTIVFSASGKITGMVVLDIEPDEARALIGFAPISQSDFAADTLWEEQRSLDSTSPDSRLLEDLPAW